MPTKGLVENYGPALIDRALLDAIPPYDPAIETLMPILLRTTRPETLAALKSRYGVEWRQAVSTPCAR